MVRDALPEPSIESKMIAAEVGAAYLDGHDVSHDEAIRRAGASSTCRM